LKPLVLIGNPENRRVSAFIEALARVGAPAPEVFAHADLLRDPALLERVPDDERVVRVDATGENPEVELALLRLGGYDGPPPGHGELVAPAARHRGFVRYLRSLHRVFLRRRSWRVLNPPRRVLQTFDKLRTSRRWERMGIPVCERLDGVATPDELRAAARARDLDHVFVKLRSGSSASGVAAYSVRGGYLMTTIERTAGGWFNSLKVRRVDEGVDEVLAFLLDNGAIVERAHKKARLDGAYMDLRVLVIDGEPAFSVVRQSRHPITNLHLGGWRGSLEQLREVMPERAMLEVLQTCQRVWRAQGLFHLGVDVLLEPGFERHRVLEANAFGDLLPDLERDGLGVYGWELARLASGRR
jgi:glutathione synthase/RimK-type ligase-like ATP-grasp enzyme